MHSPSMQMHSSTSICRHTHAFARTRTHLHSSAHARTHLHSPATQKVGALFRVVASGLRNGGQDEGSTPYGCCSQTECDSLSRYNKLFSVSNNLFRLEFFFYITLCKFLKFDLIGCVVEAATLLQGLCKESVIQRRQILAVGFEVRR
jgi:hypothetical protein